MGYSEKIDLIDYISLFEEIKKCRWKSELVDTFSKYGIKDDTERTGETDRTYKSGKSKDLYAAFVTVTTDNKKYKTHIHFQSNQISINTISLISDDRYFSKYKVRNKTSDEYRNRCFKIPYDVDEFKYVMDYFLRYDENWLNREIETVIDTAEQEDVLKAQLDNSVDDIDKEIETKQLQGEEREALIKVRVNQSAFRKLLMRRYTHCCLCDVDDESLLVASHIKPWAKSNHAEKVDVNNGLLLCPNHDKLFDRGYISFDNGGHIVISDELSENSAISMNIKNDMQIELSNDNIKYMEYHRNNVLK
jgi:predicted restriction endonuclease